jgi:hypothetical protein
MGKQERERDQLTEAMSAESAEGTATMAFEKRPDTGAARDADQSQY